MIFTRNDKWYMPHALRTAVCYWCDITEILRDPVDGEIFVPQDVVLVVSPDATAVTPHYRGCKSA